MSARNRDKHSDATHGAPATPGPRRTVRQALEYTRRGWPVFPCRPGTKEPATRHGFQDATTDPERIRWWWHRVPAANLAIATGRPGPDVLDVDQHGPAGSGFAAFSQLKQAGLVDGAHLIVATPSGGFHAYFAGSDQPSGRLPRHHLDFKATGGYVLAPPSTVGGKPYRLVRVQPEGRGLDWAAVADLLEPVPDRRLQPDGRLAGRLGQLAAWVERLEEGNRNAGLFWAACRAVEAGQEGLLDELRAAALRTGLSEREISRTIASARREIRSGRLTGPGASR